MRRVDEWWMTTGGCERLEGMLTEANAVVPLRLSKKAVELPHLAHGSLRPSFSSNQPFDLFAQGLLILR